MNEIEWNVVNLTESEWNLVKLNKSVLVSRVWVRQIISEWNWVDLGETEWTVWERTSWIQDSKLIESASPFLFCFCPKVYLVFRLWFINLVCVSLNESAPWRKSQPAQWMWMNLSMTFRIYQILNPSLSKLVWVSPRGSEFDLGRQWECWTGLCESEWVRVLVEHSEWMVLKYYEIVWMRLPLGTSSSWDWVSLCGGDTRSRQWKPYLSDQSSIQLELALPLVPQCRIGDACCCSTGLVMLCNSLVLSEIYLHAPTPNHFDCNSSPTKPCVKTGNALRWEAVLVRYALMAKFLMTLLKWCVQIFWTGPHCQRSGNPAMSMFCLQWRDPYPHFWRARSDNMTQSESMVKLVGTNLCIHWRCLWPEYQIATPDWA